jgi:RNA polymerase sigma factor (sigma-70 family)
MDLDAVVILAREAGFTPARREVALRLWRELGDCRCLHAGCPSLAWEEREDFRAELLELIDRAIDAYDLEQIALPHGRSFRSFCYQVLTRDLQDYARKLRRRKKHETTANLDWSSVPDRRTAGPTAAEAAETRELAARVRAILARWNTPDRQFMEHIGAGGTVRAWANHLGISEWAAHRKWRTLKKRFAKEMGMELPKGRGKKKGKK